MALPTNFTVRLNSRTEIIDGGTALVGGSPTRYVRLSPAAASELNYGEVSASTAVGAALADKLLELGMADPDVSALPDVEPNYTIVIPVMNRADALARLLDSVVVATAARTEGQPRIIVVDDASANPSAIENVARAHNAEFLPLPTNVGPAGARNGGLALVASEFVVFLDSDLVINQQTIPTLLKHFADPKVAVVTPRITALSSGAERDGWIARYEETNSSLDLGPDPSAVKPRSTMSWVPAAALAARVTALTDGFDASMRLGEDVDLVWRLNKAGWRIRYEPSANAEHDHRAGFAEWFRRKQDYGTSAVPLAKRHPEAIAPAILAPWGVGVMAALIAQRKWSLPVAIGFGVFAAIRSSRQLGSARHPHVLAASLTARGVGSAYTQTSALMLRHWWPLTLLGCIFSKRIRKATLAFALIDTGREYVRRAPRLDPVRYGLARRLDDIAYGSGVWLASLRARNFSALKPEITRPTEAN
jgi:mycofactocin system glycosyltransferase